MLPSSGRSAAWGTSRRPLQYNLGESLQDAGRHTDALAIFRKLRTADPDELRFAVRLFVSCQALGLEDELRAIVTDLDIRRRAPAVVGYLKAQLLTRERNYGEALAALESITGAQLMRPGVLLETADLYVKLAAEGCCAPLS